MFFLEVHWYPHVEQCICPNHLPLSSFTADIQPYTKQAIIIGPNRISIDCVPLLSLFYTPVAGDNYALTPWWLGEGVIPSPTKRPWNAPESTYSGRLSFAPSWALRARAALNRGEVFKGVPGMFRAFPHRHLYLSAFGNIAYMTEMSGNYCFKPIVSSPLFQ